MAASWMSYVSRNTNNMIEVKRTSAKSARSGKSFALFIFRSKLEAVVAVTMAIIRIALKGKVPYKCRSSIIDFKHPKSWKVLAAVEGIPQGILSAKNKKY
jgi:hypothetical protein